MNAVSGTIRPYCLKEEIWSSVIHGIGILFGVAGLAVLVTLSAFYGDVWSIVSTAIFGVSMIVLYAASTLYHAIPFPEAKRKLKKFDHISIYYLIAGSYTPFLLVNLRGTTGWIIFGIIWFLALTGTILKLFSQGSGTKFWSIGLYLLMGWLIVFASGQLVSAIPATGLAFLIAGGLFYTLGIFFYVWKSRKYTRLFLFTFFCYEYDKVFFFCTGC